jgi:hypothetical protein
MMNIFRFSMTISAMIFFSLLASVTFGQGMINIYEEPEITTLMNKYKTWNELEEMVPAW